MSDDEHKPVGPKWLEDHYGNHDRAKRSQKHEKRVASKFGGRRLPNSGALSWSSTDKTTAGGDIKTPDFLIEHKRTDNASLSLKKEWLQKVKEGARRCLRDPAVMVTFEEKGQPPDDWVLIPASVLLRLLGKEDLD